MKNNSKINLIPFSKFKKVVHKDENSTKHNDYKSIITKPKAEGIRMGFRDTKIRKLYKQSKSTRKVCGTNCKLYKAREKDLSNSFLIDAFALAEKNSIFGRGCRF